MLLTTDKRSLRGMPRRQKTRAVLSSVWKCGNTVQTRGKKASGSSWIRTQGPD